MGYICGQALASFNLTKCEDFYKALSKIKQLGLLCEYQKEFERLGNQVQGWTQKVLVETFIASFKPEITNGIRILRSSL